MVFVRFILSHHATIRANPVLRSTCDLMVVVILMMIVMVMFKFIVMTMVMALIIMMIMMIMLLRMHYTCCWPMEPNERVG
jgi:hypothetical protein